MILNGKNNSMVGHVFDPANPVSMPKFMQKKSFDEQKLWAQKETARYAIARKCRYCDRELIAEEITAHETAHVPFQIRSQVRTLMALAPNIRKEIMEWVKEMSK